jgi:P-type Mg2+ transporter
MIRTRKIPFIQEHSGRPVVQLTATIMAIGICIPFSPLGTAVGLVPLPMSSFPGLVATLLSYCVLTQLVKVWYIRQFSMWS